MKAILIGITLIIGLSLAADPRRQLLETGKRMSDFGGGHQLRDHDSDSQEDEDDNSSGSDERSFLMKRSHNIGEFNEDDVSTELIERDLLARARRHDDDSSSRSDESDESDESSGSDERDIWKRGQYTNHHYNYYCIFGGSVRANEGETIYMYENDRVNCQRCTCDRSGGQCEFCYKHCMFGPGVQAQEGQTVYLYENDPGRCQSCTCSATGGQCQFCHPFGNYWCVVAGRKLYVNQVLWKNQGTSQCQRCTCAMGPLDNQPRGACYAC